MNYSDKIITKIPLDTLWTSETELKSERIRYLTADNIKDLLRQGQVNFIIADVGLKPTLVDRNQCFDFWKLEVEKHLVTDINKINIDIFPDSYAYLASEWTTDSPTPIILLEKMH